MLNLLTGSGFKVHQDPSNKFNKVITSSLYQFESKRKSEELSLKYVHKGIEHYCVDGKYYEVNQGHFLCVNTAQQVEAFVQSKGLVEGVCVYIDPYMIDDLRKTCTTNDERLLDTPYPNIEPVEMVERILPARQSLLSSFFLKALATKNNGETLTSEDFYQLIQATWMEEKILSTSQKRIKASKKSTRIELLDRLMVAKEYILDNLEQKLTIKEIARIAMLSEFHFLRTFKQAFNQSPNQFILQHRLSRAEGLLKNSSLTIKEIALECGFNDVHYFSRFIKKHKGRTPSSLRR